MISIHVGEETPNPVDGTGRTHIGYADGLTEAEHLERGRQVWLLDSQRVKNQSKIVIVRRKTNKILAAGWVSGVDENPIFEGKKAVECWLITDPAQSGVGKLFPFVNKTQNSVSYH